MSSIVIHYPLGVQFSEGGGISNSQTKQVLSQVLNKALGSAGILETYTQTTTRESFEFELFLKPNKTTQDVHTLIAHITETLPQITITEK